MSFIYKLKRAGLSVSPCLIPSTLFGKASVIPSASLTQLLDEEHIMY